MIDVINTTYRIIISLGVFILFAWLAYWSVRFFRGRFIRKENGITLAIAVLCLSFSLGHLWSVAAAIYPIFDITPIFTFISLTARFITVYFAIAAMVFVTWEFGNDKDSDK